MPYRLPKPKRHRKMRGIPATEPSLLGYSAFAPFQVSIANHRFVKPRFHAGVPNADIATRNL